MPTLQELSRRLAKLETNCTGPSPILDRLKADRANLMTLAGMTADPWQQRSLRSASPRMLFLCSLQSGKSTVAAALALLTALLKPGSLVLLLSPSLRQSGELFRKVVNLFGALGRPIGVTAESALRLELANGSRIVSLPGTEATVRSYSSVSLLVVDEAARVPDALYYSVRPMLAVSRGRLAVLSTPFGQRGWFYEAWTDGDSWEKVRITATQCPRITKEFLEEERRAIGERWFRQEYFCSFEDMIGAVFSHASIMNMLSDDLKPLALNGR